MTGQERFLRSAVRLADTALVITGLFAFAAFVYFFYAYSLTGQRHFTSPAYFIVYYAAPLGLGLGALAALKMKPANRVNLSISAATFAVSMFVVEAVVERRTGPADVMMNVVRRAPNKNEKAAALEHMWGMKVDARLADEVITALRREGVDAVPFVSPGNNPLVKQTDGTIKPIVKLDGNDVLPLGGVSDRVTVLCNENGYWVEYRSDEHGFNNPPGIWRKERMEIAAVGDSFTQGYCVPSDKSFVGRIRARYPATLNLGMAGNGPLLMLATLREYVPRFRPPIVLWFYCEDNDLVELQQERRSPLVRNYEAKDFTQRALLNQDAVDRAILDEIPSITAIAKDQRDRTSEVHPVNAMLTIAKLSALRRVSGLVGGVDPAQVTAGQAEAAPNLEAFRQVLALAKGEVESWGGALHFVYLPGYSRFANERQQNDSHDTVTAMVRSLAIPVIDVEPPFRESGMPLALFPFEQPGHYNEKGHAVVADQVLKLLGTSIGTK